MLLKDLSLVLRHLRKNKLVAAINVLGLTIGISACLVIFLIVNYETGFDTFQPDRDRIYRVYSSFSGQFSGVNRGVPTAFGVTMHNDFTGIETVSAFQNWSAKVQVDDPKTGQKDFGRNEKMIIASPDYFKLFTHYRWLVGAPEKSLNAARQVVLTESRAKTYFGDLPLNDIMGREVIYRDSLRVNVSGIVADVREKTDFNFTDFISVSTIENTWLKRSFQLNDWASTNSGSQLFIKVSEGTDVAKITSQFNILVDGYKKAHANNNWVNTPQLQPLHEIHFNPELGIFDNSRSVMKRSTLNVVAVIAFLLLVMAAINFINLETAQASRRAREVGVRKVLGSSRMKLIRQFIMESFALTLMAVILSVLAAWFIVIVFADFLPKGMTFEIADQWVILFLTGSLFVVTILAGLYPAFVLSSTQPVLALKNLVAQNSHATRSSFIRKTLTVFQFSVSQILIVSTLVVGMQISFMMNKDLGFSTNNIVYFETPWWDKSEKRLALKTELERIPEIEVLSLHNDPPSSGGWSSNTYDYDNGKEVLHLNVYRKQGDTSFIKLYNFKLLAGRNFHQSDTTNEYVINETLMRQMGIVNPHDALGKVINDRPIVGVVADFNIKSLHNPIEPVAISSEAGNHGTFGMKLHTTSNRVSDMKPALDKIEAAWKKVYPDEKFEYNFMDDTVKSFYETEQRVGTLAKTATTVAVLISCLGLFGLSSFTVIQRTKEIGVRKVLGASVNSIVVLLSRDFLVLVVIAFFISAPFAYYVTQQWLQDFAFRMDFGLWVFLIAGLSSLLTAFITISFRTVGAAKSDPVKALRYE